MLTLSLGKTSVSSLPGSAAVGGVLTGITGVISGITGPSTVGSPASAGSGSRRSGPGAGVADGLFAIGAAIAGSKAFKRRLSSGSLGTKEYDQTKAKNKLLRYQYKRDEEYTGEVADNKAQGHGVFLFRGCKFGGLWECGYEYIGCYVWTNNVKYSGFWANGKRNGEGVEQHKNYVYKGEWVDDLKEGYGVISSNGGSRYEGTWHKGLQEGCGIEIYKDGSFYAGQFDAGLRNGYGIRVVNPTEKMKQTFTSSLTSDDETPSSTKDSPGSLTESGNKVMCDAEVYDSDIFNPDVGDTSNQKVTVIYEGHWKDDSRQGPGVEKTSRGEIFEGNFKDSKKHGYGVFRDETGHVFFGKWSKNAFKVNKRILTSAAQKAATAGREAAVIAQRKTWLSRSRAEGARKCAIEASDSEIKAGAQYEIAEERRAETLNQMKLGNTSINVVATECVKAASPASGSLLPINLAKQAKDFTSKISRTYLVLSPKLGKKSLTTTVLANDNTNNSTPNSSTQSTPIAGIKKNQINRATRPSSLQVITTP